MRCLAAIVICSACCLSYADELPPTPAQAALTLDECVAWTLMRHPRLAEAGFEIDQWRGTALQAGLYPNPRIDSGNPQTIGPQRTTVLTTGLTQEIVTAGKLRLDQAAATEAARQSEWNRTRTRYEVLTLVRQEYFATLAAQRRRILLEKLLKLAEQSEKTGTNLFKAEQVSETDVLLLRVERRRAELALQTSDITLDGRKRQLATTMGVRDMKIESLEGSLTVPLKDFESDEVLNQILYGNPMVQMAHLEISRNLFLLQRAEVEPIPNLSVQGGFQYSYSTDNYQGIIGLYLNIPLWNQNQGNIAAAQAAVSRANASRDAVQLELTKQLTEAVQRYRIAERGVKSLEEGILPDAMRTLELVQSAYARGQFDITRLLQTQRSVFEANLDYISALEGRLSAAAEIAGLMQLDEFP
ncbi:MAG: TolC family protein [Planctomycetes bacterium]|nr:TolC family protein [Planctomycetota bacterium]